ncbi:hypothetical protein WN944_026976 [Citrus x changshan-huyou]|uniref:Uncharacterized protein n=1 Tax=Citrus x changshan-huyou TaxID=2935761 RepID=A0AAP0LJ40_9ROSI
MARHVWARHEWARARARVGTARVPGWHGTARHEMNSEHEHALASFDGPGPARHGPLAILNCNLLNYNGFSFKGC